MDWKRTGDKMSTCRKYLQNIKEHTHRCGDTMSKSGHYKLLQLPSEEPNGASRRTPKPSERAKGGRWAIMQIDAE